MSASRFIVEPLNDTHERASFSSGSVAPDRYFRQQAGQEQRRGVATVFVLREMREGGAIVGFYTLSATAVAAATLPPDLLKKLPRYPVLPAILIGRLARHERWRGQGVGEDLLSSALRRSVAISTELGALFVVVDAKDVAARRFYESFGFRPFLDGLSSDGTARLFLPLASVRR